MLQPGLNLVGWTGAAAAPSDVVGDLGDLGDLSINVFDGASQSFSRFDTRLPAGLQQLTQLDPRQGFWIDIAASATLAIPAAGAAPAAPAVQSVTLMAVRDATIYDEGRANGTGDSLFAGVTNGGNVRRALIHFDISTIPSDSTITSVTLTLQVTRTTAPAIDISLHRALADWSEGPSDPGGNEGAGATAAAGDVTWTFQTHDIAAWSVPGGDFAAPSATSSVAGTGSYSWDQTATLVVDVQLWLDDPTANFGWLVIGDESGNRTTKRFASRDSAANGPSSSSSTSRPASPARPPGRPPRQTTVGPARRPIADGGGSLADR